MSYTERLRRIADALITDQEFTVENINNAVDAAAGLLSTYRLVRPNPGLIQLLKDVMIKQLVPVLV
jgi:predicted hydrolase (HD superfamily)